MKYRFTSGEGVTAAVRPIGARSRVLRDDLARRVSSALTVLSSGLGAQRSDMPQPYGTAAHATATSPETILVMVSRPPACTCGAQSTRSGALRGALRGAHRRALRSLNRVRCAVHSVCGDHLSVACPQTLLSCVCAMRPPAYLHLRCTVDHLRVWRCAPHECGGGWCAPPTGPPARPSTHTHVLCTVVDCMSVACPLLSFICAILGVAGLLLPCMSAACPQALLSFICVMLLVAGVLIYMDNASSSNPTPDAPKPPPATSARCGLRLEPSTAAHATFACR